VERRDGVIIVPEKAKETYLGWRSDQAKLDSEFMMMADVRRKAYETGGHYY
jgi:hypothetical protein